MHQVFTRQIMKYFSIHLGSSLKVTLLGSSAFTEPQQHIRRYITEQILYVVTRGSITLMQGEREVRLCEGDVALFTLGEYQYAKEMENCEFCYIHFSPECVSHYEWTDREFLDAVCERNRRFVNEDRLSASIYDNIGAILPEVFHLGCDDLEKIVAFFKTHPLTCTYLSPLQRLRFACEVAGILMHLEEIAYDNAATGYKGRNGRVHESARRILSYIEAHFTENFTGHDIERHLLMNYDYANRLFKKYIGTSIIRYRNQLRINTSKTLLGNQPIEEIAHLLGFENAYYFSRTFKRFEGISPREYLERINQ